MIRKTITLPESMDAYIAARVEAGMYGSDSEYIRDLVRADQKRQLRPRDMDAANAFIEESLASGVGRRSFDDLVTEARRRTSS